MSRRFPLLGGRIFARRIDAGAEGFVDSLKMEDVDELAAEFQNFFEGSCKPESSLSLDDQDMEFLLCASFFFQLMTALQDVRGDRDSGRFLRLFFQSLSNRSVLNSLLKMCDASIRTGNVRCTAIAMLGMIIESPGVGKVFVSDGVSFASQAFTVFAKVLQDNLEQGKEIHGHLCQCKKLCLLNASYSTTLCKGITTLPRQTHPDDLVNRANEFNWTLIFAGQSDLLLTLTLMQELHYEASEILCQNPRHENARELLSKMGSSGLFLLRLLRHIADTTFWDGQTEADSVLINTMLGLRSYFNCLVPPPSSKGIDIQVKMARDVILILTIKLLSFSYSDIFGETYPRSAVTKVEPKYQVEREELLLAIREVLPCMTEPNWTKMKTETDKERWNRLSTMVDRNTQKDALLKIRRQTMTKSFRKKTGKAAATCANCFASEQNATLLVCARCKNMYYCSKECQKAHWGKIHKHQCMK